MTEQWVPADGSDGTVYLDFDADNTCRITREALTMLLGRACAGVKADGTQCRATRLDDFAGKRSHLQTTHVWYCHRHKDQGGTP